MCSFLPFSLCSLFFIIGLVKLLPPSSEFPVPKNELVQRFNVNYLGCVPVAKPIGKERFGKDAFQSHFSITPSFLPLTLSTAPLSVVG